MKKIEINETAEQTSRNLIDVVCTICLIGCIITAIFGVVAWAESDFAVGGTIIIIAIISIFSIILLKALLHTFINISSKLDYCGEILRTIEKIEAQHSIPNIEEETSNSILQNKEEETTTQQKQEVVKLDITKVDDSKTMFDNEFNTEIINLINAGKELDARSILIRKKNMSLSGAVSYIDYLTNLMK